MKNFKNADELIDYAKEKARKLTNAKTLGSMCSTGTTNIIYITTYRAILNSLYTKLENGEITVGGKSLKREK